MTQLIVSFFRLLSRLPLRVLYCISDFEYVMIYYVFRYRRGIVRNNLTTSFPEKSLKEIKEIERKFYRWFCDYFFEAVKLLTISREELERRFTITNSDEIEACFREGQNAAAILGHHCNWEWLCCVGIGLPETRKVGLVYKPLRNAAFEQLFRDIRSCVGGVPVPKNDILRYLLNFKREGTMSLFGYVSDQGPKWENIHLWLPFLNHDTGVFTGAERIMRKMNDAVFYVEMTRPRRGYYTCTYHLITKAPNEMEEFGVTRRFFEMLEQTIRKQPEYYLWSHNRWKRSHEEFDRLYEVVNGKVIKRNANE